MFLKVEPERSACDLQVSDTNVDHVPHHDSVCDLQESNMSTKLEAERCDDAYDVQDSDMCLKLEVESYDDAFELQDSNISMHLEHASHDDNSVCDLQHGNISMKAESSEHSISPETCNATSAKRAKHDIDISRVTGSFDLSVLKRYNMYFFTKYVTCDKVSQVNFCMQVGLMPSVRTCSRCRRELRLSVDRHDTRCIGLIYRCTNSRCQKSMCSIRRGTIFDGSNLYLETILRLIVLYIGNITSYEQLQHECVDERNVQLSPATIHDWLSHFREIQLAAIVRHLRGKIGGPDCTVQIYECKLWKRKLGKYEDTVCGICCESGGMFAEARGKPDSETMIEIIAENVAEGSTVITGCWEQYDQLERDKWVHLTANYNFNFTDPSSGTHHHSIECTYWQVVCTMPATLRASSEDTVMHSAQYIWRKKFGCTEEDICLTFIRHISELYPARSGDKLLGVPPPSAAT